MTPPKNSLLNSWGWDSKVARHRMRFPQRQTAARWNSRSNPPARSGNRSAAPSAATSGGFSKEAFALLLLARDGRRARLCREADFSNGLLRGRAQGPPARADGGLDGPRSPAHLKGVRETCRNATQVSCDCQPDDPDTLETRRDQRRRDSNSVFSAVKRRARGSRSFEYLRTILYLVAGKLRLPALWHPPKTSGNRFLMPPFLVDRLGRIWQKHSPSTAICPSWQVLGEALCVD